MDDNNKNNCITDTDVNIDSWIFVNKLLDCTLDTDFNDKTNSIQELNEDDLGSAESSDSDGISIISETELQQSEEECYMCLSKSLESKNSKEDTGNESTSNEEESLKTIEILPKDLGSINKKIILATATGMCFLAIFLWPKNLSTKSDFNDKKLEHDFELISMTLNDDLYDKQKWKPYEVITNNTCDFNLDAPTNKIKTVESPIIKPIRFTNFTKNKKTHKEIIYKKNNNYKSKNVKKDKFYKKYLKLNEKYLKKLEKEIKKLEGKLQKAYKFIKKQKINKNKNKKQKNYKKITHKNVTEDWYHKRYNGRSEIRYKEKLSDWMFERSKLRSKLRDKAGWYFSRANSREEFRSEMKIRFGKRNAFKFYQF